MEQQDILTHRRIDSLKDETVKNTDNLNEKYELIHKDITNLKLLMSENNQKVINAIMSSK